MTRDNSLRRADRVSGGARARGRLKIGDDWNAITIIALSQSNPMKAVAELIENSIDAKAHSVTVTRGREGGRHYLSIKDDGEGVPRDEAGLPDFRYVATHICNSVKRRLKQDGVAGLQGEFGIGLLSFWTIGEELAMTSAGSDRRSYQMMMRRGDPSYTVQPKRSLIPDAGTELRISPLLEGMRNLSGEKIQWYLASELRDRIHQTAVKITVVDRLARKQYLVEPRQYEGRLLHQLPPTRTGFGDVYAELYINEPSDANRVALFRRGTRVVEDLVQIDDFARPPWTLRQLQGHIDAAFVELTPGTRAGVIRDAAYAALREGMRALEVRLIELIEEQRRAEEERASRDQLKVIQRAFREALLALPAEEYDWFDIHTKAFRPEPGGQLAEEPAAAAAGDASAAPRAQYRRSQSAGLLRVRGPAVRRRRLPGVERRPRRRVSRAARPSPRPIAAPGRARTGVRMAHHRGRGRTCRHGPPNRRLPCAGRARYDAAGGRRPTARCDLRW